MNTKRFVAPVMFTVFATASLMGVVNAAETMSEDSMMKKDAAMVVTDVAMMKSDAMTSPNANLMFGSRGEEVMVLQTFLETHSFLVMPTGVAKGYFGPLTKSALMKYQASVDVPATGYFGPITRSVMADMMMKKDSAMVKTTDAMMKKDDAAMMKDDATMQKVTQ